MTKGLTLVLFVSLLPHAASAQWTWPERAENLTVLPADFPADRLRAVMTGFTRALGVRCSHCHDGEDGKPLSTFDFVSDANPKKDIAREMLRMLGRVNESLTAIDFSRVERVNMWCHTCHRGVARPQTLEEAVDEAYRDSDIDGAIERYDELRSRYYGRGAYDFGERSLNQYGYILMESDTLAAIRIFQKNLELFPASANAYDSLGEAYLAAGRTELAEIMYEKAVALEPDNRRILEKLRQVRER